MLEPNEWVIATFLRNVAGEPIMHVYGGCGFGEPGRTKAILKSKEIAAEYRKIIPRGPWPEIKLVRGNV